MDIKIHRGSWLVTVPLAGIALAYIMLFFLPTRRAIGELQDQRKHKQDYIAQAAGTAAALQSAQERLEKTRAYTSRWLERAPRQSERSTLFGQINALAKAAGATTTRFDPEPIVSHDSVHEIPLTVGIEGSFAEAYEFLRSLETLPVAIWVDNLHIESSRENRESVTCELSLVVFADNSETSGYVNRTE